MKYSFAGKKQIRHVTINNYYAGTQPEVAAFRKLYRGNWDNIERRHIRCPYCPNYRLLDATVGTKVKMITGPEDSPKPNDIFIKCPTCGNEVCVRIVSK